MLISDIQYPDIQAQPKKWFRVAVPEVWMRVHRVYAPNAIEALQQIIDRAWSKGAPKPTKPTSAHKDTDADFYLLDTLPEDLWQAEEEDVYYSEEDKD